MLALAFGVVALVAAILVVISCHLQKPGLLIISVALLAFGVVSAAQQLEQTDNIEFVQHTEP